jgi:hypothetical protein
MSDQPSADSLAAPPAPFLLHAGQGVAGRLKKRWHPDTYVPEGQSVPLSEPVIELENGHALLARPGAWRRLSPTEERVYLALEQELRTLVAGAAVALAQGGAMPGHALQVVSAAIRSQLRALAAPGEARPDGEAGSDPSDGDVAW